MEGRIVTVSKADIFDTKHNLVVFSVESSGENHRVVCRENERVIIINATDLLEHETVEQAQTYVKSLSL